MNVLLITIDSLRADHLGCYGYSRNTSPNIDKLAKKGVLFLQAISNGGGTPEAFPSILFSIPPLLINPIVSLNDYRIVLKSYIPISEILKREGFSTAAFHSNPFLTELYGYGKGFEVFESSIVSLSMHGFFEKIGRVAKKCMDKVLGKNNKLSYFLIQLYSLVIPRKEAPYLRATEITQKAISWLEKRKPNRFFLWIHYMDVHHPYLPSKDYLKMFLSRPVSTKKIFQISQKMVNFPNKISKEERDLLLALYDAQIRFVDEQIGLLLDELEEKGSLDETIIIVTADHGEEFGEHGVFSHGTVYDSTIRVPLIIQGPTIPSGLIIEEQVELLDLAPTIIDILGLREISSLHGESLLKVIKERRTKKHGIISVAYAKANRILVSYRTKKWKYILTMNSKNEITGRELYNLSSDPGETKNLYSIEKEKARELELRILDYVSTEKLKESSIIEREKIRRSVEKIRLRTNKR